MAAHTVLWRRRDMPGHEACRILSIDSGWQITGTAAMAHDGQACRLDYVIDCDPHWLTRSAVVSGWIGQREIDVTVGRNASGEWLLNGNVSDEVSGCTDIDLNFSPSTNLLPIRRLDLEVDEAAKVRAAWLRFPSFTLEPLEQSYKRIQPRVYRYESDGGRFVAQIAVDEMGLVIDYGDIWSREGLG